MDTRPSSDAIRLEKKDAPATVFLIHGYTGTPYDFNNLPHYLHEQHGVRVRVMLLPGHGTSVYDRSSRKWPPEAK